MLPYVALAREKPVSRMRLGDPHVPPEPRAAVAVHPPRAWLGGSAAAAAQLLRNPPHVPCAC